QEYGGTMAGGTYGIQVEKGSYIEIYENTVTAIANTTEAYAFRINEPGENVYVHDNSFACVQSNGMNGAAVRLADVDDESLVFEDNILISNASIIQGDYYGAHIAFKRCTLRLSDDGDFMAIETEPWPVTEENSTDIEFVDTVYYDATTRALFEGGECRYK